MAAESAVNDLRNVHSSSIQLGTIIDVSTYHFQIGDRFSSYHDINEAIKSVQNKTGVKYYLRDAKKLESCKTKKVNYRVNPELVYFYLFYQCIQGGKLRESKGKKGLRNVSTLRNGCPAHIKFWITLDKKFLEVKSYSNLHNHDMKDIKARTKVKDLPQNNVSLPQSECENIIFPLMQTQTTECLVLYPEQSVEDQNQEGIMIIPKSPNKQNSSGANNELKSSEPVPKRKTNSVVGFNKEVDQSVQDLMREKKRSNDLKEKLLEESKKRNQFLEALVRIKCMKYNTLYEHFIQD